jgi:hypothetical protein
VVEGRPSAPSTSPPIHVLKQRRGAHVEAARPPSTTPAAEPQQVRAGPLPAFRLERSPSSTRERVDMCRRSVSYA